MHDETLSQSVKLILIILQKIFADCKIFFRSFINKIPYQNMIGDLFLSLFVPLNLMVALRRIELRFTG